MKSQAGFQLTRIDEEGTQMERLGSKATIALVAHRVLNPNSSVGESLAETEVESQRHSRKSRDIVTGYLVMLPRELNPSDSAERKFRCQQ
jgi:hypothetical protein